MNREIDLTVTDIYAARERIAPYVLRTPLLPNVALSDLLGTRVSLKYEFFQATASFKPRGAFNRLLCLSDEQRARGVVAVSGGNHGKAVAYAARRLGLRALVLMPESAAHSAIEAVRADGAELRLFPNAAAAFEAAHAFETEGFTFIHPFGDPLVVAGQGTLGLEIVEDAPDCSDLVASIGGGGMIGGVALALKSHNPAARVWGVEPEGAATMSRALENGQVTPIQVSSAIATLSPPMVSELSLELARRYLDDLLLVTDREAIVEVETLLELAKVLVEPAAACALVAARRLHGRFTPDGHVVLVLCGAGITLAELAALQQR